jgi:DNA polymerase lambda
MRLKANSIGYSLNQRGLYAGVVRDPRDRRVKLNDGVWYSSAYLVKTDNNSPAAGNIVVSEREEDIFEILGVPWQEPHERVRG